ncbi:MAG: signal peptidase I [Candidatus Gastranaerophilales bacterium]|nr:signal peptidase I [Candidatus Gastranaerophilales bacterium]
MARNRGFGFYKRKKKINAALVREVFNCLVGICVAVFLAAVVEYFFGMTTNVVGVSMTPTLYNSQQIFINRMTYTFTSPRTGDVVIFLPNGNENSHYYVKRVVAVAGDTVRIEGGVLYVNDEESEWVTEKILDAGIAANEFVLESGEYFCLGDNVNNSEDSRSANIGPVKEIDMVGKVWFHMSSEETGIGFVK